MKNHIEKIFNFFFPPLCILCKKIIKKEKIICGDCFEKLGKLYIKEPLCLKCGKTKKYGHKCLKGFQFDGIIPLFQYRGEVAKLLHEYKYNGKIKTIKIFLPFLEQRILILKNSGERFDFIISVPLHPARKRERGFDQNEIFCQKISEILNVPYLKNSIERIKYTKPQAKVKKEKRYENIKGAFKIKENFEGKNILLFDDILTTGSTLNEISNLLKEKGAGKIIVFTIAIA